MRVRFFGLLRRRRLTSAPPASGSRILNLTINRKLPVRAGGNSVTRAIVATRTTAGVIAPRTTRAIIATRTTTGFET